MISENYILGTVTHLVADGGDPVIERVLFVSPLQAPEILPGWQALPS